MIVAGGNLRPSILEENLHRHGSLPQNIGLQESISYFGQKKQCVHYESGKKVYSGPALEFTESSLCLNFAAKHLASLHTSFGLSTAVGQLNLRAYFPCVVPPAS